MHGSDIMRRDRQRMDRADAIAFLREAPYVHVATTTDAGEPVLRALNGVVAGEAIYFHGSPVGEKVLGLGRQAVVGAEELVAQVPSHFLDPEMACPATSFYRSVQVRGRLEEVHGPVEKARALQGLMERFQPEGGHRPIEADDPLYRKTVEGLLVFKMSLEHLEGKSNLAQMKKPGTRQTLLAGLWKRGEPADLRAIELMRDANPGASLPHLNAPEGARFCVAPHAAHIEGAVSLVRDAYWNAGVTESEIGRAHQSAGAWVIALDATGRVIATARATADGRSARINDVAVAEAWRERGLEGALMRIVLDHSAVRECRSVTLGTRDAQEFYRSFGFVEAARSELLDDEHTEMVLETTRED